VTPGQLAEKCPAQPDRSRAVVTLAEFEAYCTDKHEGWLDLPALYEFLGSRETAIQRYMESGFDTPMMEWMADSGMSEIVYRRMQIESNKQVLALLQGIQDSINEILENLRGSRE
jgi:hypothetical protein